MARKIQAWMGIWTLTSALFHSYMIDPHNKQLPVDIIAQVVHDFFFYQLKFQQFLVISWGNKVMLDTVNFIGCHLKVKSTVFC